MRSRSTASCRRQRLAVLHERRPRPGLDDWDLNALRTIPGSAFEAVDVSSLKVSSTSYAVSGGTPPPLPPPPPVELVANPGFEASLAGWASGNANSTVTRTCAVSQRARARPR